RRRHTRFSRDWSSDVCSSDLERRLPFTLESYVPDGIVVSLGTNDFNPALGAFPSRAEFVAKYVTFVRTLTATYPSARIWLTEGRSEERRVGKECRSREWRCDD